MKKTHLVLAAIALGACGAGCSTVRLPEVTADKFEYHRTDPFGGTHVAASGISVDKQAGTVKAESVSWTTTYPAFSVRATINGYERKLSNPNQ